MASERKQQSKRDAPAIPLRNARRRDARGCLDLLDAMMNAAVAAMAAVMAIPWQLSSKNSPS
jgi:hypothetical protein